MANNISERQLKFGYWFINHKVTLRKALIGILLVINAGVWGFNIYSVVRVFGLDLVKNRQLQVDLATDRFVRYMEISDTLKPKDIKIVAIQKLPSFGSQIDVVASVNNPNPSWVGHFTYKFQTDKGLTETRNGFILPGQTKYLYDLDLDALQVSKIIIENLVWKRENDYKKISELRDHFQFTETQFLPVGGADLVNASRAVFTVTNDSNYNFYKPTYLVQLMSQGRLAGFNTVVSDNLYSGQKMTLESRWYEKLPQIDKVVVTADIDYLSDSSFIPL